MNDQRKPLIKASFDGRLDIVNVLLKHNPDIHFEHKDGGTALDWARKQGHTEIVKTLKQHLRY